MDIHDLDLDYENSGVPLAHDQSSIHNSQIALHLSHKEALELGHEEKHGEPAPCNSPQDSPDTDAVISIPDPPATNHRRVVLYTDTEMYLPVDPSNTIGEYLFGKGVVDYLTSAVGVKTTLVLGLMFLIYFILLTMVKFAQRLEDYQTYFIALSIFPALFPLVGVFLQMRYIFLLSFTHFETMYLLLNGTLAGLTYSSLSKYGLLVPCLTMIFFVSATHLLFADSWIARFSAVNRNIGNIIEIKSNEKGRRIPEIADSFVISQKEISIVPGANKSSPRRSSALGHLWQKLTPSDSFRSLVLKNHSSHRKESSQVVNAVSCLMKIFKLYDNMIDFDLNARGISGVRPYMSRRTQLVTILGWKTILSSFGALPLVLFFFLDIAVSEISSLQVYRIPLLHGYISTYTIFKLTSMNVIIFCVRRIFLTVVYPLKVVCISRRLMRIPLTKFVLEFSRSERKKEAIEKLNKYLAKCNPSSVDETNKPSVDFRIPQKIQEFIIWRNHADEVKQQNCSQHIQQLPPIALKPVNRFLQIQKRSISKSMTHSPERQSVQQQLQTKEILDKKTIIFTTPINQSIVLDYEDCLLDIFFSKKSSKIIARISRGIIRYTEFIPVVSMMMIQLHFCISNPILEDATTIFSLLGSIHRLAFMGLFSRSALWNSLKSFESFYCITNIIFFGFILGSYIPYTASNMCATFFAVVGTLATFLADSYPIAFGRFDTRLCSQFEEIMSKDELTVDDAGVLSTIVDMGSMVSAFDRYESKSIANAWEAHQEGELKYIESFSHRIRGRIIDRIRWTRRLFSIVSYSIFMSVLFPIIWALIFLLAVSNDWVHNAQSIRISTSLGDWETKSILCTCCFNIIVVLSRRLWSHAKDPMRCLGFERRVIKIPYVDVLDKFQERVGTN